MASNNTITLEQLSLVVRRKQKLRERVDELEALLAGRGTPLAQLAPPTAEGRQALVRRLVEADALNQAIDALKEAGQFARHCGDALTQVPPAAPGPHDRLVTAFFACAVPLVGATPWYAGTVDNIVALGRSVQSHRWRERLLVLEELYDQTDYLAEDVIRPDDFFNMMDDICYLLDGGPIGPSIPESLREDAVPLDPELFSEEAITAAQFPLSPQQLDEMVAAGTIDAEVAQRNRNAVQIHWNQLIDEAAQMEPWEVELMEAADREDEQRRQRTQERLNRWLEGFAEEARQFRASYTEFRYEFFEGARCPADFADRVEQAVETLLVQEGRNLLARKSTADEALYLLGQVHGRLAKGGR